ncbi:helix-turn-helix domain-containing protein [Alphaproteobacteria bacterium HT1-32]|nr:helix-turn-helix domain-containing protein [Alphaproteobacteria bacterium HT1-32]|tara:strand:+ start:416 stop:1186 length:771 start_codon:yes stop_codon:yes gene_type:complete
MDEQIKPTDYVQSLERGLAVIKSFGTGRPEKTLTEVAALTGLTRAGARRLLLTLQHLGHVRSDGKYYRLGPRVLDLGFAYLSAQPWWQSAEPFMEEVVAALGESCSAAVLDGDDIVYVLRIPASRIMTINLSIGARLPAYATSLGRVLLAAEDESRARQLLESADRRALTVHTVTETDRLMDILDQVRRQGYCIVDQELEIGLRSVSVPLQARTGQVIAALNVSLHATRADAEEIATGFVPVLQQAAAQISRNMTR